MKGANMKTIITGLLIMMAFSSFGEIYEKFEVLDRKGDCVYTRYYWTGGFSERYFKGWTCAESPSSEELTAAFIGQARKYLNDPKNRNEIISSRLSEIIDYKSGNNINRWQKACADKYYTLYANGIIDYRGSFDLGKCWGIDNKHSFTCFNDILEYKYSGIHDPYDHNRLNTLQACRFVNSELKLSYINNFKALIEAHNDKYNGLELLNKYVLESSRYIDSEDVISCVIKVNQSHDWVVSSLIADECQHIDTNKEKSCLNNLLKSSKNKERNGISATDLLLCSD